MIRSFPVFVMSLVIAFVGSGPLKAQTNDNMPKERAEAQRAWTELVKVKGGAEKLHSITNILFVDYLISRKPDTPSSNELHVLPDRIWDAGYHLDGEPNVLIIDGSKGVLRAADRKGVYDERLNFKMPDWWAVKRVIYLLETKYNRPEPIRVSQQKIGKVLIDVLETIFKSQRIDFYYEPEEMLVTQVVVYYKNGRVQETYKFSDYTDIDGIKMPQKENMNINNEKDKDTWRIGFQFNVDYDPDIFTRPLKATTVDAWKRKP